MLRRITIAVAAAMSVAACAPDAPLAPPDEAAASASSEPLLDPVADAETRLLPALGEEPRARARAPLAELRHAVETGDRARARVAAAALRALARAAPDDPDVAALALAADVVDVADADR